MHDSERLKLLHGPYAAPACKRGDWLACEYRGEEVRVGGMTDARIPWPRVLKTGKPSLIVCGDLARAVRCESEIAICHHWGVTSVTVWKWRKALDVPQINEGTARLYREYQPEKITEEATAKMVATHRTAEVRAKQSAAKVGKPAHPRTREALLNGAKMAKSPEHRDRIKESNRLTREAHNAGINFAARAANVRTARKAKGLSLTDLGKLMGIPKQAISAAENERNPITTTWLERCSRALGIPLTDLDQSLA